MRDAPILGNVIKLRIVAPWRSPDEVKRNPGFIQHNPDYAALHPGYRGNLINLETPKRLKGTSGNLIFLMIARHFRAEEGSLCGINDRLSTKITQQGREK